MTFIIKHSLDPVKIKKVPFIIKKTGRYTLPVKYIKQSSLEFGMLNRLVPLSNQQVARKTSVTTPNWVIVQVILLTIIKALRFDRAFIYIVPFFEKI